VISALVASKTVDIEKSNLFSAIMGFGNTHEVDLHADLPNVFKNVVLV